MSSDFDDEDNSLQSIDIPFHTPPRAAPDTRNVPSPFKALFDAPRPSEPGEASGSGGGEQGNAVTSNTGPVRLQHAWQCLDCDSLHLCGGEASYAPLQCGDGGEEPCRGDTFRLHAIRLIGDGTEMRAQVWPVMREVVMKDGEVVEEAQSAQAEGLATRDAGGQSDLADQPAMTGAIDASRSCGSGPDVDLANDGDDGGNSESNHVALPSGDSSDDGSETESKGESSRHDDSTHADPADNTTSFDHAGPDAKPTASRSRQREEVLDENGEIRLLEQPKLKITLPCQMARGWEQEEGMSMDEGSAPTGESRLDPGLYTAAREPRRHLKLDDKGRVYATTLSPISPDNVGASPLNGQHATEYRVYHQSEDRPMWLGVLVPSFNDVGPLDSKPLWDEYDGSHAGDDMGGADVDDSKMSDFDLFQSPSDKSNTNPDQRKKRESKRSRPKWHSMRGARVNDQDFRRRHVKLGKHVVFRRKRQASNTAGPSNTKRACDGAGQVKLDTYAIVAEWSASVTAGEKCEQNESHTEEQIRAPVSIAAVLNGSSSSSANAAATGSTSGDPGHAMAADDKWTRVVPKAALRHAVDFLCNLSHPADQTTQGDAAWSGELPGCIQLAAVGNGEEYVMQKVQTDSMPDGQTCTAKNPHECCPPNETIEQLWQKLDALMDSTVTCWESEVPFDSVEEHELVQQIPELFQEEPATEKGSSEMGAGPAEPRRRKVWEDLTILRQVQERINEGLAAKKRDVERPASTLEARQSEEWEMVASEE
ncbi:hypothetical protein B0A55_00664 [Friedmanniomyces simplex]|uniref:Uncharacterized protein n=1 Tax=Friedmanniomyces simplex TaxID=329884 RepID=A0A4U0Y273_9PEZI|nr:hypothetical protein B0A55_00664 [Friedmanniomyces simplex]